MPTHNEDEKDQWNEAQLAEMRVAKEEYTASRQSAKIELEARLDALKTNWYEWSCRRYNTDSSVDEGTVQADFSGDLIAPETFEKD